MKSLTKFIKVEIEGIANTNGYINEFIDFEEDSVNTLFVPGNQSAIHGYKIKIAGDDPTVGLYLVPVEDPSKAVKVTRIAENSAGKITCILPETHYMTNRLEIRTQFAGSGNTFLKVPRVITSSFTIDEA